MELETINKLFLELSQFSTAKTRREINLESVLKAIISEPHLDETTEMKLRLMAKEGLKP